MSIESGIYYIRSYDNDRFTLFPTYNRDQIVNVADKHTTDEDAKWVVQHFGGGVYKIFHLVTSKSLYLFQTDATVTDKPRLSTDTSQFYKIVGQDGQYNILLTSKGDTLGLSVTDRTSSTRPVALVSAGFTESPTIWSFVAAA